MLVKSAFCALVRQEARKEWVKERMRNEEVGIVCANEPPSISIMKRKIIMGSFLAISLF